LVKKKELPTFNPTTTATLRPARAFHIDWDHQTIQDTPEEPVIRAQEEEDVPQEVGLVPNEPPISRNAPTIDDAINQWRVYYETQLRTATTTQNPRALIDEITRHPTPVRPTTSRTNPSLEERTAQRAAARRQLLQGNN